MKSFAEALKEIDGLSFVAEQLNFNSVLGRPFLNNQYWMTDIDSIERKFDRLEQFMLIRTIDLRSVRKVQGYLHAIRAIGGTIRRIEKGELLQETEFFEIKYFAFHVEQIRRLTSNYTAIELASLAEVYQILDPDETNTVSFCLYDSYSEKLKAAREKLRKLQECDENTVSADEGFIDVEEQEFQVRRMLSERLNPYYELLQLAYDEMAELDYYHTLAEFTVTFGLKRPELSDLSTVSIHYCGLVNLPEQYRLQNRNSHYQPIDVELEEGVSVVTGINMGGKTMLLKSVALAQCMAQFGLFVPARKARVGLVDQILTAYETHNQEPGLSSFAYEMVRLNRLIESLGATKRTLLVIDELARTTNPIEGTALVNAVIVFMNQQRGITLLTTHFGGVVAPATYYQVKGIDIAALPKTVTPDLLRRNMDYSLIKYDTCDVPQEALTIASLLGVTPKLINSAKAFMTKNEINKRI